MSKIKNPTIQDLADYAHVSVGTVDRVIHHRGRVSPAKKKRVEEAIKQLNFNPNFLARTLALSKQFVISSILPQATPSQRYWSFPKKGIEQSASGYRDFGVVLDAHEYSSTDEAEFVRHAEIILDKHPDGVIVAPFFEKESISFIQQLENNNIPYIFIDATISGHKNLGYIGPDSRSSGYVAGKLLHLLLPQEGDILMVNMLKGIENCWNIDTIQTGFLDFFKSVDEQGLGKRKVSAIAIHTTEEDDIARELTTYYLKNPGIKGVFVANSRAHYIAKFHQAHQLGIKVVGFDLVKENIAALKAGSIDFLISHNPVFQGARAVQMLFDFFLYQKKPPPIQHVPLDIIIKENIDFYLNSP